MILITGGSGFIGKNLIYKLINLKNIRNLIATYKNSNLEFFKNKKLKYVQLDLRSEIQTKKILEKYKPKVIIHLASSYINPPDLTLDDHIKINVGSIINIIDYLNKNHFNRFIFINTSAFYSSSKIVKENDKLNLNNNYAFSKYIASKTLFDLINKKKKDKIIELRLFSVFGPWEGEGKLTISAIESAAKNNHFHIFSSKQTRDLIYIENVVDAIIASLKPNIEGGIYNICSGKPTNLLTHVKNIYKMFNIHNPKIKIKIKKTKKLNKLDLIIGNYDKAYKKLNWKPKISINDGIKKTKEWYLNNER